MWGANVGTRHLTVVVSGGTHRVAQYGQWDGYPKGTGRFVLGFCTRWLSTPKLRGAYARKLAKWVSFLNDEEVQRRCAQQGQAPNGGLYPELLGSTGGLILHQTRATREPLGLEDNYVFATDGLDCEWAYVVDLDLVVLEVYKGRCRTALGPEDRFALREPGVDPLAINAVSAASGEFQPVKIVAAWSLDDLPRWDEFLLLEDVEHT